MNKVSCFKCVHYAVTWDPKYPKGCRLFGVKTANTPSAVVYMSTGKECAGFEQKGEPKAKKGGK